MRREPTRSKRLEKNVVPALENFCARVSGTTKPTFRAVRLVAYSRAPTSHSSFAEGNFADKGKEKPSHRFASCRSRPRMSFAATAAMSS